MKALAREERATWPTDTWQRWEEFYRKFRYVGRDDVAWFWGQVAQAALCAVAEDMTATDGDTDVFRDEVTYLLTIGRP